ncbi:hypothetical protein GYB57_02215 [bacterium]|nr:hypothetical protein [bacterium]
MKTTNSKVEYLISIVLITLLMTLSVISTFGQCNSFVKKMNRESLSPFENCEGVQMAKMYPGDSAIINQELEANRTYRILIEADEYLGLISAEISDQLNDGVLYINQTSQYIDLRSIRDRNVEIKINIPQKFTSNKIERSGCVAVAVSSGLVEDLATNP